MFVANGHLVLAYEPCVMTLVDWQAKQIRGASVALPMLDIKRIMYQLVLAVSQLHNAHIYHQAIQPKRVMMHANGMLKLAGLDSALIVPKGKTVAPTFTAPLSIYSAPEAVLQDAPGLPADIWAIGCIFLELILGKLEAIRHELSRAAQAQDRNPPSPTFLFGPCAGFPLFDGETEVEIMWSISKVMGINNRHISIIHERPAYAKIIPKIGACDPDNFKKK